MPKDKDRSSPSDYRSFIGKWKLSTFLSSIEGILTNEQINTVKNLTTSIDSIKQSDLNKTYYDIINLTGPEVGSTCRLTYMYEEYDRYIPQLKKKKIKDWKKDVNKFSNKPKKEVKGLMASLIKKI